MHDLDLTRILQQPIETPITAQEIHDLSAELVQAAPFEGQCHVDNCPTCYDPDTGEPIPFRLLHGQAGAVRAYRSDPGGIFGSIRVGGGKSAAAILLASEEFAANPDAKVILLLKPNLINQFMFVDVVHARVHLNVWIPGWKVLHEKDHGTMRTLAKVGGPGVYVLPYSRLSAENGPEILRAIKADLVIADEAHTLRGKDNSGRQSLFWKWIREQAPRGVVMSGSFNRKSPADYHRLMRWTLDERMPLPYTVGHMQEFAKLIDTKAAESVPSYADCLRVKPLVKWAVSRFPGRMGEPEQSHRTIRAAFMLRLRTTPGVVFSHGEDCRSKLRMLTVDPGEPNAELQALITQLEVHDTTPDGRIVTCALEKHAILRQLTCGFYLRRFWIEGAPKLEEAQELALAAKAYRGGLRAFLKTSLARRMSLFIPSAVGTYHRTHGAIDDDLWKELYPLWRAWKRRQEKITTAEFKATWDTELVKVDDYKVRAIVAWAKKHAKPGGIVWVHHQAWGGWVADSLAEAGVRVMRKQAGDEWVRGDKSGAYVCVASIPAHGVGRNLQHHKNQLISQWPQGQDTCEQLLGRLHRKGQTAKQLDVYLVHGIEFDHQSVDVTIKDSLYDEQTFGEPRKLTLAEWTPKPKVYPEDFLRERGFFLDRDGSHHEADEDDI